jgi:uncharacterized protein (DUF1501 family)
MTLPSGSPSGSDDACGCADFSTSRRRLLAGLGATAGAAMVSGLVGDAFQQVAFGATAANPNVLVVLSLRGGADGLSMVVPHGDPGYTAHRRRIAVPTGSLIARDDQFGLHPGFKPLEGMWKQGRLAAVNAVGLPTPNRSHFSAMEVVEDADPGSSERRGWINRMVGLQGGNNPAQAVQMGGSLVPTSLYGSAPVMGLRQLSDLLLTGDPREERAHRASLQAVWGNVGGALGQGARGALTVTRDLKSLAKTEPRAKNGATYPQGSLGDALRNTATMIRGRVGARVVTIDYGSWDMHANLGTVDYGPMQSMVDELARALNAFFVDLGALGDHVTVVTMSEFGRRVEENGAMGLDHGYGNCMLLLGAGVQGGRYHGRWPGLGSSRLVDGDLAVTTDHRSVITEVLRTRMPEVSIPTVFPGFKPEAVGAMR